jgi:hypothetical protein
MIMVAAAIVQIAGARARQAVAVKTPGVLLRKHMNSTPLIR